MSAGWVGPQGLDRWREAYDRAGLAAGAAPPRAVADAVARCDVVASSDLPRAIESVARLAPGRSAAHSPLLREAPLPAPHLPIRLPVAAWDALATLGWGARIISGSEPAHACRKKAIDEIGWIESVANGSSNVAVVTHGVFRRVLALQLESAGWRLARPRPRYRHWSLWTAEWSP